MFSGVDRILFMITIALVAIGFFVFSSASLGLLARNGASFSSVAFSQITFGIIGGGISLLILSQVYYRNLRKYAFYIFLFAVVLTLLVFTSLGLELEGSSVHRWVSIGGFSFQPAEFLKIAFIVYMATLLSGMQKTVTSLRHGTLPFVGIMAGISILMLLQPDTDSLAVMGVAALSMFIVAGGRIRDVAGMFGAALILLLVLAFMRPYIMDRFTTFLHPEADPLGSGWQINQSLIAVGSGGFFGRGYGQSIQKFNYLPEATSDAIFAVYAEELGFMGGIILLGLYALFVFRGYRVASHAQDLFGTLLVVGIVTAIIFQTFLNIAGMLAVAPLSGLPLPFMSHGGTALLATLASVGIVLNVSKYQRKIAR